MKMLIRQTLSIFYYQSGVFFTENLLEMSVSTTPNLATIFIEGYFEAYFTFGNYFEDYSLENDGAIKNNLQHSLQT